jgi:EAL domain-containing protein (putative c-di-GMP-specific phosphodiesterase class I)
VTDHGAVILRAASNNRSCISNVLLIVVVKASACRINHGRLPQSRQVNPLGIQGSLFSTWGMGPQAIQFEITDSALMDDQEVALETITQLNDIGVEFYIDDFGIGYSSLSYLQKLPVDSIKIDQSFVKVCLAAKIQRPSCARR